MTIDFLPLQTMSNFLTDGMQAFSRLMKLIIDCVHIMTEDTANRFRTRIHRHFKLIPQSTIHNLAITKQLLYFGKKNFTKKSFTVKLEFFFRKRKNFSKFF